MPDGMTFTTAPRIDIAREFFKLFLGNDDPVVRVRMVHDSNRKMHPAREAEGRLTVLWPKIVENQGGGYAAYFFLNRVKSGPVSGYEGLFATDADVEEIRALATDNDKGLPDTWHLAPPIVIHSSTRDGVDKGYGIWPTTLPIGEFKPAQQRLAARYDSDTGICNPSRVLRIPGSLHLKDPAHPQLVTFEDRSTWERDTPTSYPVADVLQGLPPARRKDKQASPASDAPIDEGRLREFLSYVNPATPRADWSRIVYALSHARLDDEESDTRRRHLAHEFMAGKLYRGAFVEPPDAKFRTTEEIDRCFDAPDVADPCSLGTIIHEARRGGWKSPNNPLEVFRDGIERLTGEDLFDPWAEAAGRQEGGWKLPASLPSAIREYAIDQAPRMGARPLPLAFACLMTAGMATNSKFRLQPNPSNPSFEVPPVLWGKLSGDSGTMKSPPIKTAMGPLFARQDKEEKKAGVALAKYIHAHKEWEGRQKQRGEGRLTGGSPDGDEIDAEPRKPVEVTFYVTDITRETIAHAINRNNGVAITIYRDELTGWLGDMDRYTGSKGGDRASYLQGFDGGRERVRRRDEKGNVDVDDWLFRIIGSITTKKLRVYSDDLTDDGMLQRFLPCRTYDDEDEDDTRPYDGQAYAAYASMINRLIDLTPPVPNPPITMAPEALVAYRKLCGEILGLKRAKRQNCPPLAQHLSKWRGILARLILIFHAIECATSPDAVSVIDNTSLGPRMRPVVSGETAEAAVDFARKVLLPEALDFYEELFDQGDGNTAAHEVLRWLIAHPEQPARVKVRAICRGVRRLRGDSKALQEAMRTVEEWGWVAPAEQGPGWTVKEWTVHPATWTHFAGHIPIIRQQRAADHEAIKRGGWK